MTNIDNEELFVRALTDEFVPDDCEYLMSHGFIERIDDFHKALKGYTKADINYLRSNGLIVPHKFIAFAYLAREEIIIDDRHYIKGETITDDYWHGQDR